MPKSFLIFFAFNLQSEDQSDADSFFEREAPVYPTPDNLMGWIDSRQILTLNGEWSYIVDPMNNGLPESSFFGGFPKNKTQKTGMELIEYNFETAAKIQIPGAWNAGDEKLFFYRGPVWLYKKFNYSEGERKKFNFDWTSKDKILEITLNSFFIINFLHKIYLKSF